MLEEYEYLREMVQIETEEDEFLLESTGLGIEGHSEAFAWVKEFIPTNKRKGHYYKQITKICNDFNF